MDDDPVNHPRHYTVHPSGVECIEITRHMNFNLGNAIKYLWRSGLKNDAPTVQDLKKAVWYIQDEIKRLNNINEKRLEESQAQLRDLIGLAPENVRPIRQGGEAYVD